MKTTPQVIFDQLIADIDEDIHCFDSMDPACKNLNEPLPCQSQLDDKRPSTIKDPTPKNPLTKPTVPSPLKDVTNVTSAQCPLNPANDERWVRIQRPTHRSEDENLEVSIGKHVSLPTTKDSNSQKGRVVSGDDSATP